jgi:hypothetical protein
MKTKQQLRALVRDGLDEIILGVNASLRGDGNLKAIRHILERNGRGGIIPHWFEDLSSKGTLPNLDGKTIGSVIEMLLIAILETGTFRSIEIPPLRVNPARGVDLPDLDLGIKSPSKNYCTSEPFFSAYERLHGSEYDALVLLTDYQTAKKRPPLKLQIINWRYVTKSQLADRNLCAIARKHRASLLKGSDGDARTKRIFRFLAYVNQSDWLGKRLVSLIDHMDDATSVQQLISAADKKFIKANVLRQRKGNEPIPDSSLESLHGVLAASPLLIAITDAADNWVTENLKEAGRLPNENEWHRLKTGPLDGCIGMSPALQWRYNFGPLFGELGEDDEDDEE